MNKAVYLCLSLLAVSCSGQETTKNNQQQITQKDTIMETFNIEEFNKHQWGGQWQFTDKDGNTIRQIKGSNGGYIVETVSSDKDIFVPYKAFYPTCELKQKGLEFHGGGFNKGIWREYDEKGNIVKQTDYDEPYKNFPWEKIKAYMESKDIDLMDRFTRVYRNNKNNHPTWSIRWDTKNMDNYGRKIWMNEEIDGNTGEVILIYESYFGDEPILGVPSKKIIYDSKAPKEVYREYKGRKFYSEQEWKDFVNEDVKVWAKKNNLRLEDEPQNSHYRHQWFVSERKENERKKK